MSSNALKIIFIDYCNHMTKLNFMNQKGMSITELVVVLGIIMGMTLASIPAYHYLRNLSRKHEFLETVKMLENGLSSIKVKQILHDQQNIAQASLDNNPSQFPCDSCFHAVLDKGINNPLWFKKDNTTYYYSTNGNHSLVESTYIEKGDYQLSYDALKGKVSFQRF
ncbi:MAG: hypothetical protein ACD_73C00040G0002 [uncultured bacterium]|nr:MAG: hypothetical protein ACD_73C00040G0002 [uncultured bacterium]